MGSSEARSGKRALKTPSESNTNEEIIHARTRWNGSSVRHNSGPMTATPAIYAAQCSHATGPWNSADAAGWATWTLNHQNIAAVHRLEEDHAIADRARRWSAPGIVFNRGSMQ